jgi:hypothetical protein
VLAQADTLRLGETYSVKYGLVLTVAETELPMLTVDAKVTDVVVLAVCKMCLTVEAEPVKLSA